MRINPRDDVQAGGPQRPSDDGSMIIAMSVILIVGMLAVAVLARTMSGMRSSRHGQDFAAALGQADVGVSDALFRLDQLGGNPPTAFCVGAGCTVTSLPSGGDVTYEASPTSGNPLEVIVRSRGVTNRVPHGVQATLRAGRLFPFAIYTRTALTFNGRADGSIETVDASGNPISDPPAVVASGGTITCRGTTSPADFQASTGSNNCGSQMAATTEYNPLPPVLDCSTARKGNVPAQPCPPTTPVSCAAIPGVNATGDPILLPPTVDPGVYHCNKSIKFPASFGVTGTGTAKFFVITSSGNPNVNFSGSTVNGGLAGDPTRLHVYMAGAGVVDTGNGAAAGSFAGVMYAPGASLTENGCQATWRGAVVINTARCNGGPNLVFQYDPRVHEINDGNWRVRHFKEIPSSSVVVP
jgi:hypothetical protein